MTHDEWLVFHQKWQVAAGHIAERLVEVYEDRPVEVAEALDVVVDRSGNMLGWVRDLADLAHKREEEKGTL